MNFRTTARRTSRFTIPVAIALWIISTLGLAGAQASQPLVDVGAPAVQITDNALTTGDVGVFIDLVSSDAVVQAADSSLAGPDGVQAFVDSLHADYPNARFVITNVQSSGNLFIVDWQGSEDGVVVFPGRSLITIDDGVISDVLFLNLNNVSPVMGERNLVPVTAESNATASAGPYYPIIDEHGNAIVPEAPNMGLDTAAAN